MSEQIIYLLWSEKVHNNHLVHDLKSHKSDIPKCSSIVKSPKGMTKERVPNNNNWRNKTWDDVND